MASPIELPSEDPFYVDPLFNFNFIEQIEKRPCIWNNTLPEYNKRTAVDSAWQQVANELNDTTANCRSRWRNIRTSFLRWQKSNVKGSKKKYYLADHLKFILPFLNKGRAVHPNDLKMVLDSNEDITELDLASEFNVKSESTEEQDYDEDSLPYSPSASISDREPTPPPPPPKKQRIESTPQHSPSKQYYLEWLKRKNEGDSKRDDPNMSFFKSILPDMEKMTDKQNRMFRQRILGLIDEILDEEI